MKPSAPKPTSYATTFGEQPYVKDGRDANLLNLGRQAAAASPALASGTFAQALQGGKLSPDDVKTLQKQLQAQGLDLGPAGVDGKFGPKTHAALAKLLAAPAPASVAGPVQGQGQTKDGLTIPNGGQGRATTFWNGHMAYKGKYDMENRQNKGIGAWGDTCDPNAFFVALPVTSKAWHNQKILVRNPATGQQVVARVQDKGPHPRTGAKIDLSPVTMEAIGGKYNGDLKHVRFEFAPDDAPVGPVKR